MSDSPPARWIRGEDRSLLKTRIYAVRASKFRHPKREGEKEFFVIDPPDWAMVVPITPEGELVMVRQYRFGIEALSLELPGGVIEPGEDPRIAAVRELAEETGYGGDEAVLLGSVHPNPAIQSNRAHVVLVPNVTLQTEIEWDEDEELAMELMPIAEVLRRARTGEITHALMLNALFLLEGWWRSRSDTALV
jgi:ADP-ribose pyrophosphatase